MRMCPCLAHASMSPPRKILLRRIHEGVVKDQLRLDGYNRRVFNDIVSAHGYLGLVTTAGAHDANAAASSAVQDTRDIDKFQRVSQAYPPFRSPADWSWASADTPGKLHWAVLMSRCFLAVTCMLFTGFDPKINSPGAEHRSIIRAQDLWTSQALREKRDRCMPAMEPRLRQWSGVDCDVRMITRKQNGQSQLSYTSMFLGRSQAGGTVVIDLHRLVCWLENGMPPASDDSGQPYVAAHICLNAACINPFHLHWQRERDNKSSLQRKRRRLFPTDDPHHAQGMGQAPQAAAS